MWKRLPFPRSASGRIVSALALAFGTAVYAPEVLAFSHVARSPGVTVYSERSIDPRIGSIVARADALVAESPLAAPLPTRRLFLASDGWRWQVLSLFSGGFGITHPLSNAIVVRNADIANDQTTNGAPVGGRRTLSGVIAHETAHLLTERRIGLVRFLSLPQWKAEGIAEVVARESSLTPADAARVRTQPDPPPSLAYFDARRRVASRLVAGEGIDALLAP